MVQQDIPILDTEPAPTKCRSPAYRLRINCYVNSRGVYVEAVQMVPLKRLSCPGTCRICHWLEEDLREFTSMKTPVNIKPYVKDGGVYRLNIVNQKRDWETGYVEEWDLEFVLEEGSNNA